MTMQAGKLDDLDLMQYADGELDESEAREVATGAESDDKARHTLAALDEIHETVRTHLELAADEAEPQLDALWATIEKRITANGVSAVARPAPAEPARRGVATEHSGLRAAIGRLLEGWRGYVMTGAVAAAAAAVVIMAVRPAQTIIVEKVVRENQGGNATTEPTGIKLVNDEPSPPDIEHLEVNDGSGTVFVMPSEGDDDVSATVIFIDLNNDAEEPL